MAYKLTLRDERDNKIGSFYVDEADTNLPVGELIEQIYNEAARRERIEYKARQSQMSIAQYAKVCFTLLVPPKPKKLDKPIPFDALVDSWSV